MISQESTLTLQKLQIGPPGDVYTAELTGQEQAGFPKGIVTATESPDRASEMSTQQN